MIHTCMHDIRYWNLNKTPVKSVFNRTLNPYKKTMSDLDFTRVFVITLVKLQFQNQNYDNAKTVLLSFNMTACYKIVAYWY